MTFKTYFRRINTSPITKSTQFWPPDLQKRGSPIKMYRHQSAFRCMQTTYWLEMISFRRLA